jgi:hypothetical protein
MITCARLSVAGLSSTGLKSECAGRPAASACSACARPISPPSMVTAELSAMFCGLKGATRTPRRCRMRHRRHQHALAGVGSAALNHQAGGGGSFIVESGFVAPDFRMPTVFLRYFLAVQIPAPSGCRSPHWPASGSIDCSASRGAGIRWSVSAPWPNAVERCPESCRRVAPPAWPAGLVPAVLPLGCWSPWLIPAALPTRVGC